jgi:hypothetical protein
MTIVLHRRKRESIRKRQREREKRKETNSPGDIASMNCERLEIAGESAIKMIVSIKPIYGAFTPTTDIRSSGHRGAQRPVSLPPAPDYSFPSSSSPYPPLLLPSPSGIHRGHRFSGWLGAKPEYSSIRLHGGDQPRLSRARCPRDATKRERERERVGEGAGGGG